MLDSAEAASSTGVPSGNQMESTSCFWEKLMPKKDPSSYEPYEFVHGVVALAAFASTAYFLLHKEQFKLRKLAYGDSYSFFTLFIFAMNLRVFVPKFCRFLIKYTKPEYVNCENCGLLESFLTIMEIETLTHVCINRYVVAKYIYKGWPLNKDHFNLYLLLCFFFALVYSTPPIFGMGNYALDFNCETCGFDMILPKRWRYFLLGMWLLRSVKPVMFMLVMIYWTRSLEAKFNNQMKMKFDSYFTRIVELVLSVCLFSWAPMAIVRGCVIFSQLQGDVVIPSKELVTYAPIIYEISPILVTLVIALTDSSLDYMKQPFEDVVSLKPDEKKQE